MKRSEICEEIIYVWTCPKCEGHNETSEDPMYEDKYYCEQCGDYISLEDD